MTKRIEDKTAPDKHVYYAHGPNCWGRALTIHKAIAEARFNLPTELKRKRWNEWEINLVPWPDDIEARPMVNEVTGGIAHSYCDCGNADCIGYKAQQARDGAK